MSHNSPKNYVILHAAHLKWVSHYLPPWLQKEFQNRVAAISKSNLFDIASFKKVLDTKFEQIPRKDFVHSKARAGRLQVRRA